MKAETEKKIKIKPTSMMIDPKLYNDLKLDLTRRNQTLSDFWEDCARTWLEKQEKMRPSSAEKQVMDGLRKLIRRDKAFLDALPPLLKISREVLEEFLGE